MGCACMTLGMRNRWLRSKASETRFCALANLQEERNRKALELLLGKDTQIKELQEQVGTTVLWVLGPVWCIWSKSYTLHVHPHISCHKHAQVAALTEECDSLRVTSADALTKLDTAESHVLEVLRAKDALRVEVEAERSTWEAKLVGGAVWMEGHCRNGGLG